MNHQQAGTKQDEQDSRDFSLVNFFFEKEKREDEGPDIGDGCQRINNGVGEQLQ